MLRSRYIDRICGVVLALTIALTGLYMGAAASGAVASGGTMGYETRLFDNSYVHTIDIVMDDWDGFLENCTNEEYVSCKLLIDGENCGTVAIRAKGNTSLTSVAADGNDRYSFKIEFDHYEKGKSYYGLDKLSLNNLIQDKTFMKDYFAYTLMGKAGVASPLCSYTQIRVNGEDWGLYLAVEAVEESFLQRNYGQDYGNLYKPDSMSFGGGRGNGREFDMDSFREEMENGDGANAFERHNGGDIPADMDSEMPSDMPQMPFEMPENGDMIPEMPSGTPDMPGDAGEMPSDRPFEMPDISSDGHEEGMHGGKGDMQRGFGADFGGGQDGGRGSADVKLQYINDDPESYANIFDNAKTDVNETDKQRLMNALKLLSEGDVQAVDTPGVAAYFAVHDFLCNGDSYTGSMVHNYYLYEKDGALSMIPWDYNLAFGAFDMKGGDGATETVNSPIDSPVSSGDISDRPMVAWIFESEESTQLYHEAYSVFIADCFESGWFEEELGRVTEMIAPYVQSDPTAFYSYDEFVQAAQTLGEFCALRARSVRGQLSGDIPSTSEGQQTDNSALIDASEIDLGDMGDFNMGGGDMTGRESGQREPRR